MHELRLSRREFLQATAVAGTGAALVGVAGGLMTAGVMEPELWAQPVGRLPFNVAPVWASRVNRWAQLTLTEDDPAHLDVGFWLDYFARTKSDGVCLSGGGCVAYYPTEVPYHHRAVTLGDGDVLGELVAGCRKQGMSVLIRTDPHATYDDAKAAHPEWIAVTADGQPRRHWASPEMWVTCALGPYNFEFMTAVHKEITAKYRPDGIFMNRWDGSGDCYCESCRKNFKATSGLELPRTQDPRDPGRRAFLEWRRQRLIDVLDVWNREIGAINPVCSVVPNNGSGAQSPLDAVETSRRAPMLAADRQARHGLEAPWLVGKSAKEYRATMGEKPVIGLFGIGLEEPERWKDSVTSNAEIRIWALEAIANGMRPWFTKFSGTLRDQRWLGEIETLYGWTEQNDAYLKGRRPIARVALVYSQQTNWYVPGAKAEDAALGWYQALVESRIPFEMVHDRLLGSADLAAYRTLILPNIVALSDAQCAQVRAFVAGGGNVVATNQTSLCDEWGARRKNLGLAELFGIDWTGKTEDQMQNSYIRLEHEAAKGSPMFAGLEDAPRVINGVSRVEAVPREKFAQTPFTLVPSYPDLPMEKVYPRVAKTDISCLYMRQAGGHVAYFPFDIDRTFWEVLNEDHLKMMRNALEWAHNEPAVVEVDGPGLLDVTAWRNARAITVHLVNLTNPMAMKGPYRDFFPVGPHTVKVRMPEGVEAKGVRLLASGKDAVVARSETTLNISVPSIRDHEVVAVEV
jgi:hypothetical protein